jgi:hypothetical protein
MAGSPIIAEVPQFRIEWRLELPSLILSIRFTARGFGLSLPASGRRPGWVGSVLADGRRRRVPRAATDLDPDRESSASQVKRCRACRCARCFRWRSTFGCCSRRFPGSPLHPDHLGSRACPTGPADGAGAEGAASDDAGGSAASGTTSG